MCGGLRGPRHRDWDLSAKRHVAEGGACGSMRGDTGLRRRETTGELLQAEIGLNLPPAAESPRAVVRLRPVVAHEDTARTAIAFIADS